MASEWIIDCHAHIVDPARFPFPDGPGYMPRPDETGTREAFGGMLDLLDALADGPGRFKAIAVVEPEAGDRALEALADSGVVGVRFDLPSYDPGALSRPEAPLLLERLQALGLFAQVFADYTHQWAEIAPVLRASRVRVLVDHFGVHDLVGGIAQPGFRAVLGAFGPGACVFGSDWPFLGLRTRPDLGRVLKALGRWLPDRRDRQRVLWDNPFRLFGFEEPRP